MGLLYNISISITTALAGDRYLVCKSRIHSRWFLYHVVCVCAVQGSVTGNWQHVKISHTNKSSSLEAPLDNKRGMEVTWHRHTHTHTTSCDRLRRRLSSTDSAISTCLCCIVLQCSCPGEGGGGGGGGGGATLTSPSRCFPTPVTGFFEEDDGVEAQCGELKGGTAIVVSEPLLWYRNLRPYNHLCHHRESRQPSSRSPQAGARHRGATQSGWSSSPGCRPWTSGQQRWAVWRRRRKRKRACPAQASCWAPWWCWWLEGDTGSGRPSVWSST